MAAAGRIQAMAVLPRRARRTICMHRHTHGMTTCWLAGCLLIAGGVGRATEPAVDRADPRRAELVAAAAAAADRLWEQVGSTDPGPTNTCREFCSAALAVCESRQPPERLARFLTLAAAMQDRDPQSAGFGNFRWYWRDEAVTDPNAVEFCGIDMHLIWRLHGAGLPAAARTTLGRMLDAAVDGCLRHRVRPSYTNIAILNAANLITLGELTGRADAAAEGYRRLDCLAADIWQFGLHEYCSPTYYAVDVRGLAVIERWAAREAGRSLARCLLELVWTDIAVNFFPPAERLAGPHSRTYDYLRGLGGLQQDLRWQGWSSVPVSRSTEVLHVALGTWVVPPRLLELSRSRWPRLVRQAWGPRPTDSRTHWLLHDVTLGCAAAGYGSHDSPLTIDLPGKPGGARGYLLPDGREDPYGRRRFGTGLAQHPKALHLEPFWAAAQRDGDAVGLVVYRDADLVEPHTRNLQTHLVLPGNVTGLWLRGERLSLPGPNGDRQAAVTLAAGDPLVIRDRTAAVAVRLLWAQAQDGLPADIRLVGDGPGPAAMRLTVEHRSAVPTARAAAAFWIRVGGGLGTDADFAAWRKAFERAEPTRVAVTPDRIELAVPGTAGSVAVAAGQPFTAAADTLLEPAPCRGVLELDGVEIGRPILEQAEPCRSFAAAASGTRRIAVPARGAVLIEAEDGLVLPRMAVGDDGRGTRHVWQPDDGPRAAASGSVSWRLRVATAGRYWLWGRVRAPDGTRDSFTVSVRDARERVVVEDAWHLPRAADWQWAALRVNGDREPTPIDLPAGEAVIMIAPREAGTRLDALWLTTDSRGRPEDGASGATR